MRDDFEPDSDIDLLGTFALAQWVGLLSLVRLERELSNLFGGRRVDLRTPAKLSRSFRDHVVDTARVLYEQS